MADIKCTECGTVVLEGTKECPNCGCPLQNVNETISIGCDDYDYSQFYNCPWILRPWRFSCEKASEKENFDQLNDICLLSAIGFRMVLRGLIMVIIVAVLNGALSAMLLQGGLYYANLLTSPLISVGAFILFFYYLLKGVKEYWVPFHRTFRRINKRYWMSMHKAVKDNAINNI